MISLKNGYKLCESVNDLPNFHDPHTLFLDIESENNTYGKISNDHAGMYPFGGDRVAGFALTVDDIETVWYVPLRHSRGTNLPIPAVVEWLQILFNKVKRWINHNIVFDACFLYCEGVKIPWSCELLCTLTAAKILDSDRFGHGLKQLSNDWGDFPMEEETKVKAYLKDEKSKSWACVPPDLLGEYACDDVRGNRYLFHYIDRHMPDISRELWETEKLLTSDLFDMECQGLRIDPQQCQIEQYKTLQKIITSASQLEEIVGHEWTDSNKCMYETLVVGEGLPVLSTKQEKVNGRWIDTGRPCFDKDTLKQYEVHPQVLADEKLINLMNLIQTYRKESQFNSLFLTNFLNYHDETCHIHPNYNQNVRTGRMSSSRPNSQQQNKRSKLLILPDEGYGFISADYSQIEYRLIVHYIRDARAIRAYIDDPDTDFHTWVAELLGIGRKAGKTLNFGMAYGAGERTVTNYLLANPDIIEVVSKHVNSLVESGVLDVTARNFEFQRLCAAKATEAYAAYHSTLPGIKETARRVAATIRDRGYVFNFAGRVRRLPRKLAYKGFNSIVQGGAMDLMKERMVSLSPRRNDFTREHKIRLACNVHDEILLHTPLEYTFDPKVQSYIKRELETPKPEFGIRVPIRTDMGVSRNNWAEACGDETILDENGNFLGGKLSLAT